MAGRPPPAPGIGLTRNLEEVAALDAEGQVVEDRLAAYQKRDLRTRRPVAYARRCIFFHGKRHRAEMGAPELTRFLTSLVVDGKVVASTRDQVLSALLSSIARC